jgi:biotin transport system substrate-specific component
MKTLAFSDKKQAVSEILLVPVFALFMALAAYIRIPLFFTPVPLTTQTFVLFLSVIFLGRKAVFSQMLYLAMGIAGLPVFTNGASGLFYMLGPTAGYLASFVILAVILPYLLPKDKNTTKALLVFFAAALFVLFCGAGWLAVGCGFTFGAAVALGVLPFVVGDLIKAVAAALIFAKK